MDPHRETLDRLFRSIQARDHASAAACYHADATFEDIAFRLAGRRAIHAMWHMIAETDLVLDHAVERADATGGRVRWTARYTFRDTGRPVRNEIESQIRLRDGLIASQADRCDARRWGIQALGLLPGLVTWLVPAIRRRKARAKLDAFIAGHPEYRDGRGG